MVHRGSTFGEAPALSVEPESGGGARNRLPGILAHSIAEFRTPDGAVAWVTRHTGSGSANLRAFGTWRRVALSALCSRLYVPGSTFGRTTGPRHFALPGARSDYPSR